MSATATAASPSVLSGMVAVSKDSDITPLGYVVWYSVPDEDIAISRLRRQWLGAGLDPQPLPRDPRAVDAFKRAVRDEEKEGNYIDPTTRTRVETDVRKVVENEQDVIYQVTRVERDLADERVRYSAALKVWYSKVTGDIGKKPLEGGTNKDVLVIMDSIQSRIDANAKSVTGAKVRTMVRGFIVNDHDEGWREPDSGKTYGQQIGLSGESLGGTRKGVYFVLAKYRDQLEALAEALHRMYRPHGRAYLYYLPMADGASERELVRRHHKMNVMEAAEQEIVAVRDLLKPVSFGDPDARERAPRSNVIKLHYAKLDRLRRRAGEYREVLQEEVEDIDTKLSILNRQCRGLMNL